MNFDVNSVFFNAITKFIMFDIFKKFSGKYIYNDDEKIHAENDAEIINIDEEKLKSIILNLDKDKNFQKFKIKNNLKKSKKHFETIKDYILSNKEILKEICIITNKEGDDLNG